MEAETGSGEGTDVSDVTRTSDGVYPHRCVGPTSIALRCTCQWGHPIDASRSRWKNEASE